MAVKPIAVHGLQVLVPENWEVRLNKGHRDGGHLVFIDHRTPTVNLSWERFRRAPDFERTIAQTGKRMARDLGGEINHIQELSHGRGRMARITTRHGDFHLMAAIPDPDHSLVLVLRQLHPGGSDELRDLVDATVIYGADDPTPWRIHGLAADLPPWWHLHRMEHVIGMARAVWFHRPDNSTKTRAVLVLRRYACASRLLGDESLETWTRTRLDTREELTQHQMLEDGTYFAITSAPGSTWWRRFRRIREERRIHTWVEADSDRLVVQEWHGFSTPLPLLRYPQDLKDGALRSPVGG